MVIDQSKMLPPFPFLTWDKAAIRAILRKRGFDLKLSVKKLTHEDGSIEYSQEGEQDASEK
jgi:hypothetical protein